MSEGNLQAHFCPQKLCLLRRSKALSEKKIEGLWYKDDHARKLRKDTEKINHAKPIVACFSVNDYDTGRQGNFGETCTKLKPI